MTGKPAPENGARAAEGDSGGNADDIARAESGSQGSRQGAEGGKIAGGLCLFPSFRCDGEPQGLSEAALWDPQLYGKEKMGSHKQE